MRVRKQRYNGQNSVAIYIKQTTKKIRDKLLLIEQWEQYQKQVQAESYRATVNHELRTPLESCIFLLK